MGFNLKQAFETTAVLLLRIDTAVLVCKVPFPSSSLCYEFAKHSKSRRGIVDLCWYCSSNWDCAFEVNLVFCIYDTWIVPESMKWISDRLRRTGRYTLGSVDSVCKPIIMLINLTYLLLS